MYKIIKNKAKIEKCQDKFEEIMKDNTEPYKCFLSFQQDRERPREKRKIYWSSKYKYWSGYEIYKNKTGTQVGYWNSFGLEEPKDGANLKITIEISFSIDGKSKRIQGVLAEDETGRIYIAHRGKIAKGSFNDNYNGVWIDVEGDKVALIGVLPQNKDKEQYSEFQKRVGDFILEIDRIKKLSKNEQEKAILEKEGTQFEPNNSFSESYEMIVREAKDRIMLINQNCKNLGEEPIYKESELFGLWIDIEKVCSSKEGFDVFSSSLYKLVIENPRGENPNYKNDGHFYEYRYSKYSSDFWRDGTITKDFIDDVRTIRHEFAHTKSEKKIPVKTKAEILKKYLGSYIEPRLPEKYQEFQFGVLKEFVSFLNELLKMVESYKNLPKNH